MTLRGRAAVAAAWILVIILPSRLEGQTSATIEVGSSVVKYEGFDLSSAATVTPAIRYDAPNLSVGTEGKWVLFESGNQIGQLTAAAAWLTKPRNKWRAEFSGSLGISQYADEGGAAHLLARTRFHYQGDRAGAWASAGTGQSVGDLTGTPVELAIGGWTVQDRLALSGSVTTSAVEGDAYTDIVGAARWATTATQFDAQIGIRPPTGPRSGDAYGELSALVRVNERIRLALSGGSYPSDPIRATLGAGYLTVGLQIQLSQAPIHRLPIVTGALLRVADELAESAYGSDARLEVAAVGSPRVVRVLVGGATSVELMGDFTDWLPVSLEQSSNGVWEIAIAVTPGAHRINVRVNAGQWMVPMGTRLEETEFGDAVGVIIIP